MCSLTFPDACAAKPAAPDILFAHSAADAVFGAFGRGYPAEVSGYGERSLMQVEPARLVELAESSETILAAMREDWAAAHDDLAGACGALGDVTGAFNVSASYADSLADAGEVVAALTDALGLGVAGLVDAAHDALRADDTAAFELDRTARHLFDDGSGPAPGTWGS